MSSSILRAGDIESYGQIVLFGDSITEQSFDPEFSGYGSALANAYTRRLDVKNRGFSGYTTVQALDLLPRIFPHRDDDVKVVVLFFGANDATLPGTIQHVPLDDYLKNCEALLTSSALRGKVIAVTPPPIEGYSHDVVFGATRTAEVTHEYGVALKELCQRLQVPCADVWNEFMVAIDWKVEHGKPLPGSLKVPKNERLCSFFRDGLHPIGSGYKIIYNTIQETITANFSNLAPDVVPYHTPYWEQAVTPKKGTLIRWHLDTSKWTDEAYKQNLRTIPSSDAQTVEKFHFAKDRNMALGSILLQRRFIADILGQSPDKIGAVVRDDDNRPMYRHSAVRAHDFNVSHHAGTVALVAVLESGRVGVDVTVPEQLVSPETSESYLSSFQDVFSRTEWAQIGGDLQKFAQHWALKEAYVKATGAGILGDLPSIEFQSISYVDEEHPLQNDAAVLYVKDVQQDWHFELHFLDGHYVAIAKQQGEDSANRFVQITI
ncbi:GDSL Lipase/Acylhydrolase family protein [Taphrina deformans PYCC 5710]|uniref:GDSL Lipase/Acylhydrolase family protein n=1 Tax=Taphrina deformans (strain PYCC 5710 / ATCC 11124 / CBS 356.35 / IMI 108563 / JCM 9778 / NBRC 8474) TaxID=1097556 RepID=R4XGD4_TAPDE|nr:GDSL Lipase/Acylhydrolase family protein [Taphrina deformans PYCC 5710]|eukprot:CCG82439.1 GDSL Lipase/Acylhydrolase family protein [Taphrina deformans PYCC 5710]